MKLIRKLDRRLSSNGKYFITYGLFWCDACKQLSEEYFIGLRQIYYIIHNKQWISLNENYEIIKVKRFNKKQINEIRNLYKAKIYTQKEISEIYGLSQGYVSEIVTNKRGLE